MNASSDAKRCAWKCDNDCKKLCADFLRQTKWWFSGLWQNPIVSRRLPTLIWRLPDQPAGMSLYQFTALLAEEMGRRVDIVLLPECRFRERIEREGETWTLAA